MSIIVPNYVAERIAKEDAAAEQKRQQAAHAESLATLTDELRERIPQITDPDARKAVYRFCSHFISRGRRNAGSIVMDQPTELKWDEAARVMSAVLLGPAVDYEVKTCGGSLLGRPLVTTDSLPGGETMVLADMAELFGLSD